jgi:hypothetical protein
MVIVCGADNTTSSSCVMQKGMARHWLYMDSYGNLIFNFLSSYEANSVTIACASASDGREERCKISNCVPAKLDSGSGVRNGWWPNWTCENERHCGTRTDEARVELAWTTVEKLLRDCGPRIRRVNPFL